MVEQLPSHELWIEELRFEADALPEDQKRHEAFLCSMVWELDWDLLRTVHQCNGLTDDEVDKKRTEYRERCRETLLYVYGYAAGFEPSTWPPASINW